MNSTTYLLGTDTKAAQNLDIQHDLMAGTAYEQLSKGGLQKGMVVWDIGCGSGAMTEYLARHVGEEGHVYALDASQEQLARTQKRLHRLQNVSFVCDDIITLENFLNHKADLVYARMVLMHLKNPQMALQKMSQLLKLSGTLVLQEPTINTAGTLSGHQVVQDYFRILITLGNFYGVDFNIGKKLPMLCQELGCFALIEDYVTQQHLNPVSTKEKLLSRLEEWEGKALEANLVTLEQLQYWKKELQKLSGKNPSNFFHIPEQTHAIARKIAI